MPIYRSLNAYLHYPMLTYRILNTYFQYLKCLFTSFLMPIYNILKIYNGSAQLEMVSLLEMISLISH